MKKKILFIDRDGTIIDECPNTNQIDSIEKINFLPKSIYFLSKIVKEFKYILIMVTNQDGLGTNSFPEKTFWPIHNLIIRILKSEGIHFFSIHIDRTFQEENSNTRKPNIGMLSPYLNKLENYSISESFVIGDRITDVLLACKLGCKSIWIKTNHSDNVLTKEDQYYYSMIHENKFHKTISLKTDNWKNIYEYLSTLNNNKMITHERNTLETQIRISLSVYGTGKNHIKTGIGFFDHLLQQLSFHSLMDINIQSKGDHHIDDHHIVEDIGISLGEIFDKFLGEKKGIERYGFYILPMDECLSTVAIDISGRSELLWNVQFYRENIGKISTEMFYHFFKSFSMSAKCNVHINSNGINEHHKIESIFKCFARAIRMAITKDSSIANIHRIPSSKGLL
ncbi:bifunctional histidinol-phosphatase/imidazoleglycerol-phosphate dehydratase HisB [Blattabacterium cuenoti]|uniref:bifunctional histidinol-phosphatase/imidazoleglycerol-phosphate dehydratase HisB n=1 Tax=Blattabacterium cuenoti TaxID=1653831 RepID=UPI00163C8631|nr:bifunctional histidinol-phosphatase/imidazoleglycerol-phosphate dehydratase HisB [Blattabacterium cuenoti]